MPLSNQLRNRLTGGDTTAQTGRDILTALGFTEYFINGQRAGWRDVLGSGQVLKVGRHALDLECAKQFLMPGWVFETQESNGQWRARVAPTPAALNTATFTPLVATEPLALFIAIAISRAA